MSITSEIAARYSERIRSNKHLQVASALESFTRVAETIVKVVAAFNRQPDASELANELDRKTGNMLRIIPKSFFRVQGTGSDCVLSGYMTERQQIRTTTRGMTEIAKNTFMDKADNSIWTLKDGQVMRTASEDIDDLIESVTVTPYNKSAPVTASVNVPDLYGPENTQFIYYVDPVMRSPHFGVRVGDDNVLCFDDQNVVEIASDLVMSVKNLRKMDYLEDEAASVDPADQSQLIEYYRKVFDFNPEYFAKMQEIIKNQAVV